MANGKPEWSCGKNSDANSLLYQIEFGGEVLEIPWELSDAGKDLLGKCLVRDPDKRWTAKMLLNHPFVAKEATVEDSRRVVVEKMSVSPRSAFDFNSWMSSVHSSLRSTFTLADSSLMVSEGELKKLRRERAEVGGDSTGGEGGGGWLLQERVEVGEGATQRGALRGTWRGVHERERGGLECVVVGLLGGWTKGVFGNTPPA